MAVGAYWLNEDRASNRVGECLADARRHNGNARSIPTCDEKTPFGIRAIVERPLLADCVEKLLFADD